MGWIVIIRFSGKSQPSRESVCDITCGRCKFDADDEDLAFAGRIENYVCFESRTGTVEQYNSRWYYFRNYVHELTGCANQTYHGTVLVMACHLIELGRRMTRVCIY